MVGNTTLHEALKEHSFTAGLSDPQVAKLSGLARQVSFEENDLILIACEQSKHFYLLLSGSVCVEARMRAYTVCIQVLGPGDAFGWSSLLDQHDTLFQVRAGNGRSHCVWMGRTSRLLFGTIPIWPRRCCAGL